MFENIDWGLIFYNQAQPCCDHYSIMTYGAKAAPYVIFHFWVAGGSNEPVAVSELISPAIQNETPHTAICSSLLFLAL